MEGFNPVDIFQIEIGLNQWPSDLVRNTQENVCRIPAVTLYYIPEDIDGNYRVITVISSW